MKDWDYFDKFEEVTEKYLPTYGQGNTMASQIVTAVNKLVYKWFNDGDVYDNRYNLEGWANDLSSYANWLDRYASFKIGDLLLGIKAVDSEEGYTDLLAELCETLLDKYFLSTMEDFEAVGDIYDCVGRFKFFEGEEGCDY